jgi:hypothetical protein
MKSIRFLPFVGAAALAILPVASSAQVVTLTLIDYAPTQAWTTNSTNGTNTATQNSIAAMQTHTSLPPLFGQNTLELFCVELGQFTAPVNVAQPNYTVLSLSQADSGIPSSQHMETYAGITSLGIGATAADRLSKLYGKIFGTTYNPSGVLATDTLKAAFQLAVWEVSHDDDFSLSNPGAGVQGFYVSGSQSGLYNNAIAQANAWLSELQANYASTAGMALAVLHHPATQDLIVPIPEWSSFAAVFAAVSMALVVRRRRLA